MHSSFFFFSQSIAFACEGGPNELFTVLFGAAMPPIDYAISSRRDFSAHERIASVFWGPAQVISGKGPCDGVSRNASTTARGSQREADFLKSYPVREAAPSPTPIYTTFRIPRFKVLATNHLLSCEFGEDPFRDGEIP